MGCDVHCFLEVQTKNKKWHLYNQPYLGRNYHLFGLMAGVRSNEEEPIVEPRGLPKDIGKIVKLEAKRWQDDAHTHSWLSKEELKIVYEFMVKNKYCKPYDAPFGYVCGNDLWDLEQTREQDKDCPYVDCRLVFWFDN